MKNHMRYVFILILGLVANIASAQQVNPVPDYTFANRMSAGRNTVTDTAAYFSIGPRYGAIRGMMPPMVVDTASVSGNKRNGLLIFSVQKNKFVYWDSVGVKWAEMAGTGGTAISSGDTASMLLPYLRKADTTAMLAPYLKESDTAFLSNRINLKVNISDTSSMLTNYVRHAGYGLTKSGQAFLVDTAAMATRARVQKGIDSVAVAGLTGSGTTNYVAKFTGTKALGNSVIYDDGTNVGIGTTSPRSATNTRFLGINATDVSAVDFMRNGSIGGAAGGGTVYADANGFTMISQSSTLPLNFFTNGLNRLNILSNGNIGIGTTTDAGYKTDIAGTLRSTLGANFATTSGNVGVGTASPSTILHLQGTSPVLTVRNNITASATQDSANNKTAGSLTFGANGSFEVVASIEGKYQSDASFGRRADLIFSTRSVENALTEKARLTSAGELLIGTTTDAGAYALQVAGSIYNTTGAVLAASSGNVGIGTASPSQKLSVSGTAEFSQSAGNTNGTLQIQHTGVQTWKIGVTTDNTSSLVFGNDAGGSFTTKAMYITNAAEILLSTSTDAGDYKLQINGNERIAGKLDVITTTEYGVNLGRSGTSATGFQAYNSTAAMAVGIESSAGGGLFTGTSAYAAVFGNANNYPTQFITNNAVRATINGSGQFLIGGASATNVQDILQVFGPVQIRNTPTSGSLKLDSTALTISDITNRSPISVSQYLQNGSNANPFISLSGTWNTSANINAIDLSITNTSSGANANYMRLWDGTNEFKVTKAAEIVTAAPTGGAVRKWKLGEAATVSPTSPNRTIRVEIDGTVYYLHAKTTND